MIKPNNRASPEGKQADLATFEEMHSPFGGWRQHLSSGVGGDREAVEGGRLKGGTIKLRPKGATTTLGAEGPVKLKNLKNLRAGGPSTLTPRACPFCTGAAEWSPKYCLYPLFRVA